MRFERKEFIRIDLDPEHYYYSFGVPGFEICLEPCAAGFDVAMYENGILSQAKRCTKSGDYLESVGALFGERKEMDWIKALEIANELMEKRLK